MANPNQLYRISDKNLYNMFDPSVFPDIQPVNQRCVVLMMCQVLLLNNVCYAMYLLVTEMTMVLRALISTLPGLSLGWDCTLVSYGHTLVFKHLLFNKHKLSQSPIQIHEFLHSHSQHLQLHNSTTSLQLSTHLCNI